MASILFINEKIEHSIDRFQSNPEKLTPEQENLLNMISQIIHNELPKLKIIAIKGFMRMSLREWVSKTNKRVDELIQKRVDDVYSDISDIFTILKNKLTKILRNANDKEKLSHAIDAAFEQLIKKRRELEA